MKTLFLNVFCLLMVSMCSSSCRAFDHKSEVIAHRDFKSIKKLKKVTGADLINWAESSDTFGPFKKIPYVLVQELKINSKPDARKELGVAYESIYRKLISGGYGHKRDSVIYEGGEERAYNGMVKVEKYAYLYLSVLRAHLHWSETGEMPNKGENELRKILDNIGE